MNDENFTLVTVEEADGSRRQKLCVRWVYVGTLERMLSDAFEILIMTEEVASCESP